VVVLTLSGFLADGELSRGFDPSDATIAAPYVWR
jgi:hypothetical protein